MSWWAMTVMPECQLHSRVICIVIALMVNAKQCLGQEQAVVDASHSSGTSSPSSTTTSAESEGNEDGEGQYLVLSVHAAMMALLLIIAILVFVVIIALVAAHPRGCRAWYKRQTPQRGGSTVTRRPTRYNGIHTMPRRAQIRGQWRPQVLLPPPYELATSQMPILLSPSMGYLSTSSPVADNSLDSTSSTDPIEDSTRESSPLPVVSSTGVTHITVENNSPSPNLYTNCTTDGNHISVLTIGEDQGMGMVQQRHIITPSRKPPSYEEAIGQ